jgi:hypothetical protein
MALVLQMPSEYLIEGKMLTVEKIVSDSDIIKSVTDSDYDDYIKRELLGQMAIAIYDNKCIEFTKQHNISNSTTHFRCRIFVTPDHQVRILRNLK